MFVATCRPAPVNLLIQNRSLLPVPGSDAFRLSAEHRQTGSGTANRKFLVNERGIRDERPHTR